MYILHSLVSPLTYIFSDDQLIQLYQETDKKTGSILPKCVNYLSEEEPPEEEYFKPDWHHSKL